MTLLSQIVEKMTHEEKMQLKEEIAKAVPKEIHELLGSAAEEDVAREEDKANEVILIFFFTTRNEWQY